MQECSSCTLIAEKFAMTLPQILGGQGFCRLLVLIAVSFEYSTVYFLSIFMVLYILALTNIFLFIFQINQERYLWEQLAHNN